MLPLETKQSGGKLLPHSDLRGGSVSKGSITQQEKGHFFRDMNVRNLYRTGSLMAAARELARYKLDLVGVQEVRWDKGGKVRAGGCIFFLWKKKRKSSIANTIFCIPKKNSISS